MSSLRNDIRNAQIDQDKIIQGRAVQKSMSDPVSKVEMALKNSVNDMKPITIKACKYLLPCGKCDKTDKMCSQWQFMPLEQ